MSKKRNYEYGFKDSRQQAIKEELEFFIGWVERGCHLLDAGNRIAQLKEELEKEKKQDEKI